MENYLTDYVMPNMQKDQQEVAEEVIEQVLEGEVDPIRLDVALKAIENTIKLIRKNEQVKVVTLNEAENYGAKTFEAFGAKITITGRKKYDFASDPKWKEWKDVEQEAAKERKKREKFLKSIPLDEEKADVDTGEVCTNPLVSENRFLKITFN